MGKPFRVAIGVPDNHPTWRKPFILSLFSMMDGFKPFSLGEAQEGRTYELQFIFADKGGIADMRNAIANAAVDQGFDAILWLDSDMTFPSFTAWKLLSHLVLDPSIEAVSGLYTHKTPPYMPHIYAKFDEEEKKYRIASSYSLKDPMNVDGAGFGCLLMRTSVFARVQRPYFTMVMEDGIMRVGEDLGFCTQAKMRMVLDPSVNCGHLSERAYGIADHLKLIGVEPVDGQVSISQEQKDAIIASMPGYFQKD